MITATATRAAKKQLIQIGKTSCYFVHFFAITARLRLETFLISHFMEDENARQGVSFFCELKYIPVEFNFSKNCEHLTN